MYRCASVAAMIKGKTPEEIRNTFNIKNDFTPEEEAKVREENRWCEEQIASRSYPFIVKTAFYFIFLVEIIILDI